MLKFTLSLLLALTRKSVLTVYAVVSTTTFSVPKLVFGVLGVAISFVDVIARVNAARYSVRAMQPSGSATPICANAKLVATQ